MFDNYGYLVSKKPAKPILRDEMTSLAQNDKINEFSMYITSNEAFQYDRNSEDKHHKEDKPKK